MMAKACEYPYRGSYFSPSTVFNCERNTPRPIHHGPNPNPNPNPKHTQDGTSRNCPEMRPWTTSSAQVRARVRVRVRVRVRGRAILGLGIGVGVRVGVGVGLDLHSERRCTCNWRGGLAATGYPTPTPHAYRTPDLWPNHNHTYTHSHNETPHLLLCQGYSVRRA